ncbi:MAG: ABC transporter permease [Pirellulaceae bacterium]|nr:ABC transporter permease [Pirellulaceae bacterium]
MAIIARQSDEAFANALQETLEGANVRVAGVFLGQPIGVRQALRDFSKNVDQIDLIATHRGVSQSWGVLSEETLTTIKADISALENVEIRVPQSYHWPTFLENTNILSVLKQMSVTAIIAIGMTMVIITAGIDLSVGSLIALSSILVAWSIELLGGAEASISELVLAATSAVLGCALLGLFSATMITRFGVPAFIVTLGVMEISRGLAYKIRGGPSPYRIDSESFHELANGSLVWGIPNPVIIMILLYAAAYFLMTHTALGRYIYAVGGNAEAARLSGIPVKRVLLFVYIICAALAGLGGVMNASLFSVGDATSGRGYELLIIAAVVVGGTSLMGGEGKMLGTLLGALILAVIRNGMYLTNVDTFTQMIVFGALILAAVLLDQLKNRTWRKHSGPNSSAV